MHRYAKNLTTHWLQVFRTYNASETLQNELPSPEDLEGHTTAQMKNAYDDANRKVAILCNHQRTVSKAQEAGLDVLRERLELLRRQKNELTDIRKKVKSGSEKGIRLKSDNPNTLQEKAKKAIEDAKDAKEKAKTKEEKVAATEATEAAKDLQRQGRAAMAEESHLFARVPSVEQCGDRIEKWDEKIRKLELDIRNKDDNKEVALGTSKINYCDPRISVAWCKRCEVRQPVLVLLSLAPGPGPDPVR